MNSRLDAVRDGVRTQLWPLPTVAILFGLGLGVGLPRLEDSISADISASTYLFGGGPSAARTLLGAIASSLITVTALTFSLTVLTLQLASSQFSPRLLRTFTSDRFVHVTLALFLGTFTYSLAVLRTVRDADEAASPFVPQVSVTLAFILGIASVLGLVLFLAHLAREIRVETMLHKVRGDATSAARRLLETSPGSDQAPEPVPPSDAAALEAATSGFLIALDEAALLEAAIEAEAVVVLDCIPGAWLVAGTPIGVAWPRPGGNLDGEVMERLREQIAGAITSGFERTAAQDIGYGLRQLTDVAIKALSPGINDPTTAVHALAHSSALLCELVGHDFSPQLLRNEDGEVRVVLKRHAFPDLLELAIAQPRLYGAADPVVLARLFEMLRELAWLAREPDQHRAISKQLERLRLTVSAEGFGVAETARFAELATRVEEAQVGRWYQLDPSEGSRA